MSQLLSLALQIGAIAVTVWIAQKAGQKRDQERLIDAVTTALGARIECETKEQTLEDALHAQDLRLMVVETTCSIRHPKTARPTHA
jgi:3-deoxy-D-arabino-heptulosonate 7-phosphate (DAHP) synthase